MNLNLILLCIIIFLIIVLMIMVISNKKNKNNSKEFKELRMELSSMLMQTREELNKNIGTRIAETANINTYN